MSKQVKPEYHAAIDAVAAEQIGWTQAADYLRCYYSPSKTLCNELPHFCSPSAPRSVLDGLLARLTDEQWKQLEWRIDGLLRPYRGTHSMMRRFAQAHSSVLTLACLDALGAEVKPEWRELVEVE